MSFFRILVEMVVFMMIFYLIFLMVLLMVGLSSLLFFFPWVVILTGLSHSPQLSPALDVYVGPVDLLYEIFDI
jgi:hypothetical protein